MRSKIIDRYVFVFVSILPDSLGDCTKLPYSSFYCTHFTGGIYPLRFNVAFLFEILYIVSCVRRPVLNALETPRDSLGVGLLGALKLR